jgi:hypothetical protein
VHTPRGEKIAREDWEKFKISDANNKQVAHISRMKREKRQGLHKIGKIII